MVNTEYLLSKALQIGNAAKASKGSRRDTEDSFRSMLDKNVQKTEDTSAKQTDAEPKKTDAAQESEQTKPKDESLSPKAEETQEEPAENEALQAMVQQCAMANEQKLTLNWAQTPAEGEQSAEGTAPIAEGEQISGADAAMQPKTQEVSVSAQSKEPMTQTAKQDAAAVQLTQENQPKQEQQTAQVATEGNAETKDIQLTLQKSAEGRESEDAAQSSPKEQGQAELSDAAAMPKLASKEGEQVLVKVGETVELAQPKAAEQLADSVLVKVQENTNEYELQLSPQELGKIKIKLSIEDGRIHISMLCENQKAADLLGLTSGRLRGIIEDRTGSEAYIEVQKEDANPYSEQEKEHSDNGRGYDQSRRQENKRENASDFMQQLRLGLVDLE